MADRPIEIYKSSSGNLWSVGSKLNKSFDNVGDPVSARSFLGLGSMALLDSIGIADVTGLVFALSEKQNNLIGTGFVKSTNGIISYDTNIYVTGTPWNEIGYWYSLSHPTTISGYGITDIPTTLPASDVYTWAKNATKPTYTPTEVGAEPSFSKNTGFNKNFGAVAGTVLEGRTFGTAAASATTDFIQNQSFYYQLASARISGTFFAAGGFKPTSATIDGGSFSVGNGDGASYEDCNIDIHSWNGIGIIGDAGNIYGDGTRTMFINARQGHLTMKGTVDATGYKLSGVSTFLDWSRMGYAGTAGQYLKSQGTVTTPVWTDFPTIPAVTISGSFSGIGTATTVFTVTIGQTMANTTYKVNATPTSLLSAAVFYIANKTTTTFDVTYLTGLTGTCTFDWILVP